MPENYIEALRALADSKEKEAAQQTQICQQQKALDRQAEVIDELFDYSSILRIAIFNKCKETDFDWHKLKAASKALGLETKKVPCPRFRTKNLYNHKAWKLVYPETPLPEITALIRGQE